MNGIIKRRLPGIEFQVEPAKVEDALPRMDIAAFVGFASSGPADTPIPIEEMARFREIFGEDLLLARDPKTGEELYAHLAPAVEAFFKNGGKRCWVVRVGIEIETDPEQETGERKEFSSELFLDKDIADVGAGALLGEMNHKYHYIKTKDEQPLKGVHSLFPLEEVTLVAVPDAVQRGWESKGEAPVQWLQAPELNIKLPDDEQGNVTLEWSEIKEEGETTVYTLQECQDPLFQEPVTLYYGEGISFSKDFPGFCPQGYFYRVNARISERLSPWSNTLGVILPPADFEDCRIKELKEPYLELTPSDSPPGNEFKLTWWIEEGAVGYVLEEAESPDFASPVVIYEGSETSFQVKYRSSSGPYFYRVRATGEMWACWSNTCVFTNPVDEVWLAKSPEDYEDEDMQEDLLKVHQALLRFCAARGDMFAVLGLPHHYNEDDASDHVDKLKDRCENEKKVLSFGGLYHPWLYMSIESNGENRRLSYVPPGGVVCGMMAARALSRGAWIAPANEPLKNVTALEPVIQSAGWEALFKQQVNVIRQDPRGFMLLSAVTLSENKALQPINVRRLLILLRRLAIREGMTYVFQPNNRDFHRRVQHRFEQFLARMYSRGAFAGDRPETSYQVVTDSSVNTIPSLDQGRFIIELRVAPSLPMTFITVRLVQTEDKGLSIMEI
jgi:hypothetical protein